jgi:NAD(P)H-flavin reductase
LCEGPFGLIKYEGNGNFLFKKAPLKPKKRIVLIAGGTGVTPLYNIAANSIHAKEGL